MDNNIKEKILHEISYLDNFIAASKPLIDFCKTNKPNFTEITALALILHSFYNGVENIIILILKSKKEYKPSEHKWHKAIFETMFIISSDNNSLIRQDLKEQMLNYLRFRHFIRHSYSSMLNWDEMKSLVENLVDTWEMIKSDFEHFLKGNIND